MIKKLLVKKLNEDAILPQKDRDEDEGYDIFSIEELHIPGKGAARVKTGIAAWVSAIYTNYNGPIPIEQYINNQYWLQIEGRSGLASKGIFPIGGIVDSGYRGEIMVMLVNISDNSFHIKKEDKIAQLIIRKHRNFLVQEVYELDETDRGDKGFGSSDGKL